MGSGDIVLRAGAHGVLLIPDRAYPNAYLLRMGQTDQSYVDLDDPLRLEFDRERRDRYGRLLAYVHAGDTFVNLELLRRGFAEPLTIAPNDRHATLFRAAGTLSRRCG